MQKEVMKHSYAYGSKEGLGLTLAAIAFQESDFGKYKINWTDPSFGAHHILLKTATNMLNIKGHYNKILLGQQIMEDYDLSANLALMVLDYWKKRLKREGHFTWRALWGSYNAGNNYDGSAAKKYSESVAEKILWIQRCGLSKEERSKLKAVGPNYKINKIKAKNVVEAESLVLD